MSLNFTLSICPTCKQEAILVNGVFETVMEFINIDGKAYVRPHAPTCSARGA